MKELRASGLGTSRRRIRGIYIYVCMYIYRAFGLRLKRVVRRICGLGLGALILGSGTHGKSKISTNT